MKKLLLGIILLLFSLAVSAQSASQSYIEKFKDNAVRLMHETGVPASIILAAAMHESASGTSRVARNLNNQFGVRGFNAHTYVMDNKKVRTTYKKYGSVMDSFQDFVRIMTVRPQFSHLAESLNHYDYVAWAKGIQHSGYCSSKIWASRVIAIIRKYQLNTLDENPEDQTQLAANK
jgi:flagellum-specific peptidoglycan hydrolase FlgJ